MYPDMETSCEDPDGICMKGQFNKEKKGTGSVNLKMQQRCFYVAIVSTIVSTLSKFSRMRTCAVPLLFK